MAKVEVLLATMFFEKESDAFLDEMNVQSDIVIGNQCNEDGIKVCDHKGHKVTVLSSSQRGVGKNRNAALQFSDADIVLFADNDVRYYDGYREKIEEYYARNPKADVVIFNFKTKRGDEELYDINLKDKKAGLRDITKFGTWAITAKRSSLAKHRITFSLLFGGGAKYSCGEDTVFLADCYNKGLNIYLCSDTLGEVIHNESTWFNGINEKYVRDKGALFGAAYPKLYGLFLVYHVLKHRKTYGQVGSPIKVLSMMLDGAREYRS